MTLIHVIVRNMETREIVHNRTVDHDNPIARQWMGKTAFWAFRNNHEMESRPVND